MGSKEATGMIGNSRLAIYIVVTMSLSLWIFPDLASAHCDTMDGPVVKAAQKAIKERNVNRILIWVQNQDERELKYAFRQTLLVRRLSKAARELADRYLFETVVRLHRAGEGEPYTGLKPAGTKMAPIIKLLDNAIDTASAAQLLAKLPVASRGDVQERFKQVIALKNFDVNDVEKGREYVKAYVTFIHHVEEMYGDKEGE
jgi:hypothetical protein